MDQVEELNYHGKRVKHKRTGVIRIIFVLEGNDTPSGNAAKKGYDCLHNILYDTYVNNIVFYDLID